MKILIDLLEMKILIDLIGNEVANSRLSPQEKASIQQYLILMEQETAKLEQAVFLSNLNQKAIEKALDTIVTDNDKQKQVIAYIIGKNAK